MDILGCTVGSTTLLLGYPLDSALYQHKIIYNETCAAKDEGTAVKATFLAAVLYLSFGVLSPLIGVVAHGALGPELSGIASENILILMAMKYLPPALVAVFVAVVTSALMSTSDSSLLAGATMFTENIVKVFKPGLSDKEFSAIDTYFFTCQRCLKSGDCSVCINNLQTGGHGEHINSGGYGCTLSNRDVLEESQPYRCFGIFL